MIIKRQGGYSLKCDGCGKFLKRIGSEIGIDENSCFLRQVAFFRGWIITQQGDYCTKCAAKM